jgi:hypothetical protein
MQHVSLSPHLSGWPLTRPPPSPSLEPPAPFAYPALPSSQPSCTTGAPSDPLTRPLQSSLAAVVKDKERAQGLLDTKSGECWEVQQQMEAAVAHLMSLQVQVHELQVGPGRSGGRRSGGCSRLSCTAGHVASHTQLLPDPYQAAQHPLHACMPYIQPQAPAPPPSDSPPAQP